MKDFFKKFLNRKKEFSNGLTKEEISWIDGYFEGIKSAKKEYLKKKK